MVEPLGLQATQAPILSLQGKKRNQTARNRHLHLHNDIASAHALVCTQVRSQVHGQAVECRSSKAGQTTIQPIVASSCLVLGFVAGPGLPDWSWASWLVLGFGLVLGFLAGPGLLACSWAFWLVLGFLAGPGLPGWPWGSWLVLRFKPWSPLNALEKI